MRKVTWPNASIDTTLSQIFNAEMLMLGIKQMIETKNLIYTSITKEYYGHVDNFGGVTIYISRDYFGKLNHGGIYRHDNVWVTPYADTKRMDDLCLDIPIPTEQAIQIYEDWCNNHPFDDENRNHKALLEELQGNLALAAIEAALC